MLKKNYEKIIFGTNLILKFTWNQIVNKNSTLQTKSILLMFVKSMR